MTARTSTVLKAQFMERDPADHNDDLVDTLHNPQSAVTLDGAVTLAGATTVTGALVTAAAVTMNLTDNLATALDVQQGSTDYITANTTNNGERVEIGVPLDLEEGIDHSSYFELFDDFIQQVITENDTPWILNAGASGTAIDPAISAQESGVIQLTTGDDDGTTAQDGSQLVAHIPVQADSGALVFETRLHINTATTNVSVNAGLTDVSTLEEPFTVSGTSVTSNASDGVCFVYDTDMTTDEWWATAVDTNVDDTGRGTTGTAPVQAVYQVLRIEVSVGGGTCQFFINDTLVNTLSGGGVSPDVNLYATVIANGDGTASKTVDIDYIKVGHTR